MYFSTCPKCGCIIHTSDKIISREEWKIIFQEHLKNECKE